MKGKTHTYHTNKRVRDALTEYGIPCWMLASELNCHVNTVYNMLRIEQSEEKQRELIDTIKSIAEARLAETGERVWADSPQYKRIIEILEDYWVTQPNEEYVEINMYFRKSEYDQQTKHIIWRNPFMVEEK